MRPDSHTSAIFVAASGRRRLQERDVRRAGQVPVLRVADHEIQDVLIGGEHDDRRVTDLGAEPVDPVLPLLRDRHSEEGVVVRLLGRWPRQGAPAKSSVKLERGV